MYFMARIPGMLYAELGSALYDFKSPGEGKVGHKNENHFDNIVELLIVTTM